MILLISDKVSSIGTKASWFPGNWGNFLAQVSSDKSNTGKAFYNADLSKYVSVQPSEVVNYDTDHTSLEFAPVMQVTFDVYIPDEQSVWFAGIVANCRKSRSRDSYTEAVWGIGHLTDGDNDDITSALCALGDSSFVAGRYSNSSSDFRDSCGFSVLEDYIGLHRYQVMFCWPGYTGYYLFVDNTKMLAKPTHVDIAIPYGVQFWSSSNQEQPVLFSNVIVEWGYSLETSFDLERNVERQSVETETKVTFDLQRDVFSNKAVSIDLQRDVRTRKSIGIDLQREISVRQKFSFDLQRDVRAEEKVSVDFERDVEECNNQLCAGRPTRSKLYINTGTEENPVWQTVYILQNTLDTGIVFAKEQWRY